MSNSITSGQGPVYTSTSHAAPKARMQVERTRMAGDRFVSTASGEGFKKLVEADLQLSTQGSTSMTASGTVKLQRALFERLVPWALRDCREIQGTRFQFDPASGHYRMDATVSFKGIKIPATAYAHPTVSGNHLGVQLDGLVVNTDHLGKWPISSDFLLRQISKTIAAKIRDGGIEAKAEGPPGFVSIEPNSLLHNIGALPGFTRLETDKMHWAVDTTPQGDVAIRLGAPTRGAAATATPDSDISMTVDGEAVQQLISELAGPDLLVDKVTFGDGKVTLDTNVDAKPVSDALTAAKALFILAALAGGGGAGLNNVNADPVSVRLKLKLDARIEGSDLVLTADMARAIPEIAKKLGDLPLTLQQEGNTLRIDTTSLLAANHGQLESIKMSPEGLEARFHLDLEKVIDNPVLLGTNG